MRVPRRVLDAGQALAKEGRRRCGRDDGRRDDNGGIGGDCGQPGCCWWRSGWATRETERIAWGRDGDGRLRLNHFVVGKGDELQATVSAAGGDLNGAVKRGHVP